jgi:Holliday junction resolvase
MTGGRASRDKGNRTERAVVRLLRDRGLAGERVRSPALLADASVATSVCRCSAVTCAAKRSAAATGLTASMPG